jgi:hypothetical protein
MKNNTNTNLWVGDNYLLNYWSHIFKSFFFLMINYNNIELHESFKSLKI